MAASAAIRALLDKNGFTQTSILSYAIKHSGAYYGPFREAADSSPKFGDRKTYQMDPRNAREGLRDALLDIEEGADMLMVKPALPNLDLIWRLRERTLAPICAYHVSSEFSSVKAADRLGWVNGDQLMYEHLIAIRRAGADLIVTYAGRRGRGERLDLMSNDTLFAEALTHFPGGVSSPVRAFRAVGGTPKFFKKASGAWFEDEDGQRFLDLCMSWGPLILGHAHPDILAAVTEAMQEGLTFGAPSRRELALARTIKEMVPFVEKMRFVSSGTEAVMSALRAARGFTGRERILKFEGCYHGHSDGLLVKAGSGLVTFGAPTSAGVPKAIAELTSVVTLDDLETLERTFAEIGNELAAAIIEPIPANNGLLLQRPEFLKRLRELCTKHGVVLIFDEVISGFRVAPGGAAERLGITPDMGTYGKIIGGGMPVGLYGGRKDIMGVVAPDGPVYQAGTLSGQSRGHGRGPRHHGEADPGLLRRAGSQRRQVGRGLRDHPRPPLPPLRQPALAPVPGWRAPQ